MSSELRQRIPSLFQDYPPLPHQSCLTLPRLLASGTVPYRDKVAVTAERLAKECFSHIATADWPLKFEAKVRLICLPTHTF